MPFADLPGRGEHSAPNFAGSAEELSCYFSELDNLYAVKTVTQDAEKKQGVLKYLATAALERTWKASETYVDVTKTYDKFKKEIHEFYPGSMDNVSTIQHLDMLIGEQVCLGIRNATELGEFHLQFRTISKYLISKNCISKGEEMRGFLRALQLELESRVRQGLQNTKPDHDPQDPYNLKELYNVAVFCIKGSMPAGAIGAAPVLPINIKAELQGEVQSAIKSAMSEMTEMFKNIFVAQVQFTNGGHAHVGPPQARGLPILAQPLPQQSGNQTKCHFCSEPGHFMRECEVVGKYICIGKCKCNHENKLVLPLGAVVPWHITGTWLKDHFNEYHRQNPNETSKAQMLCEVVTLVTAVQDEDAQSSSSEAACLSPQIGQLCVYTLKRGDLSSKAKKKAPQLDTPTARIVEIHSDNDMEVESTKFTRSFPPHKPCQPDSDPEEVSIEHPFAQPPLARNTPDDAEHTVPHKNERVYTNSSLIYDSKVMQKVFEQILDTGITLTQWELLLLVPELHTKVADATVCKRLTRTDDTPTPGQKQRCAEAHMPAVFVKVAREPPADATIIKDPYEVFLHSKLGSASSTDDVKVAMESNSLRAILPTVMDQEQVKAILDLGCQIVAMSEEVCIALGVAYDPNVCLNMILANGGIDQSLGLAKNVPFQIGDITLYLQVHVLRQPTYDILLGRPFNVLTKSVVCNYSNENQTITILDPNSSKKATVPTVKRGSYRFLKKLKRHALSPSNPDF